MKKNIIAKTSKLLTAAMVLLLAAAMLFSAGCTFRIPGSDTPQGTAVNNGEKTPEPGTTIKDGEENIYGDGVIGEHKEAGEEGSSWLEELIDSVLPGKRSDKYEAEAYPISDGVTALDPGIGIIPEPKPIGGDSSGKYDEQLSAGTLTAGEIKDLKDIQNWISLWNDSSWDNIRKSRGLFADNVITVSALPLTAVSLLDGDNVVYKAVSDLYGSATFVFPDSMKGKEFTVKSGDLTTTVTCTPGASATLTETIKFAPQSAKSLDLMLMIDTTGSMGDELEYIKIEIRDVIERIRAEQDISVRLSVNFYRDEGDEYVVKYFDFRSDIDECVKILCVQSYNGGGDYPEAVHPALGNDLQHSWREDSVKLCFFVLDAPPHDESEIQGINAGMLKDVAAIAAKGIRIIPVVSSGADLSVESLMRAFAVMTGGTYLFLTDHSGIGGEHQTPTDTQYEVEPLNDCMVRVVKDYVFVKS